VKLSELTEEQLELLAEQPPAWLVRHYPDILSAYRPEGPGAHSPDYVEPELPEEIQKLLLEVEP
jgi:hypothetical protein